MTADMWLGILGPFCVRQDGAAVPVPAARQRAVLAVLAVRAGQVVSFEELAETVWDGAPPAGARGTLRGYVKRLRQVLGPGLADRLVTREPGYLLDAAADEVDLLAFDRLCAQGGAAVQAGEWQQAWQVLGQAVALWRGEPLADLGCEALRRELLPQLACQRLQAIEWRADAGL
ncbi:MAG TPA: BTAD domain-containing putative transcriptional regulator, partial [Streptosporangiaceae bacterium]